jgi:hypothetical protein
VGLDKLVCRDDLIDGESVMESDGDVVAGRSPSNAERRG